MALDYIDDRLYAWARWAIRQTGPHGYDSETVLYRMVRDGVLIRGTGHKPEPEAMDEEATDRAITALRDRRPDCWQVLVVHYLGRGTVEQKCKDVGLARRTYFDRLATAKDRVDAFLMAMAVS